MERTNTQQDNKTSIFGVASGIAQSIVGVVIGGLVVFYFLVNEAAKGNIAAIMALTVGGAVALTLVGGLLTWATIWLNQKQDERAMTMLAKMMQMNAMENQMIVEQQKRMAIPARNGQENNFLTIDGDALRGIDE